jgi:hypothetical protein
VLQSKVASSVREERVLAITTVSVLAEMAGDQMKPFLKVKKSNLTLIVAYVSDVGNHQSFAHRIAVGSVFF